MLPGDRDTPTPCSLSWGTMRKCLCYSSSFQYGPPTDWMDTPRRPRKPITIVIENKRPRKGKESRIRSSVHPLPRRESVDQSTSRSVDQSIMRGSICKETVCLLRGIMVCIQVYPGVSKHAPLMHASDLEVGKIVDIDFFLENDNNPSPKESGKHRYRNIRSIQTREFQSNYQNTS